jgi:hypothetical protein
LLKLIVDVSVVSRFRPVGGGDAAEFSFKSFNFNPTSSAWTGWGRSSSSSRIGDSARDGVDPLAEESKVGSGGRGMGSGSGRLTRLGEEGRSGSGGNERETGRLSGLLVDGSASVSSETNTEFGLDCEGYRNGRGENAGSASANSSTSSGSTRIEYLAEDRREDDSTIDDLEERRDRTAVDNRCDSKSALKPSIDDRVRSDGDLLGFTGDS